MPEPSDASCVACGSGIQFYGRRGEYEYFRCPACGTIQLHPLPTREELERAYTEAYATAGHISADPARACEEALNYHKAILRALGDHCHAGNVAEIGAGWGGFARQLVEHGFQYEGVEPSEAMAAHCREQGLPVKQGDMDVLPRKTYSAIVMCSVFEHLVDHEAWLGKANRLLPVAGLLITGQPTSRFLHLAASILRLGSKNRPLPALHQSFSPPWHAVLFSIRGMQMLLLRHQFELVEVRPMPQGRSGGITGWLQRGIERLSKVGWALIGARWPLVLGHIFIFRKTCERGSTWGVIDGERR